MSSKQFQQQENRFEGSYSSSIFETLKLAYWPYRGRILATLAIGLIGRLCLLGNANVIGLWVDAISKEGLRSSSSEKYLMALAAMALLGLVFTLYSRIVFSRLSARAVSQIYDEVTWRTSRFPMVFFDRTPVGRVITRFSSDYGNVFRLFGGPLAEFLAIIFDLISMTILISVASPLYLPMVGLMALFNYWLWRTNRDPLRKSRRDLSASRSPSIAHFSETAQGSATIRSFNKEKVFEDRFTRLDQDYLKQKLQTVTAIIKYSFKMNSLTALVLLATGVGAYFWLQKGWITVGSLGVALGFISLSGTTVQMFFEWLTQFEEALVGMERLDHYLRMDLESGAKLPSMSQIKTQQPRRSVAEETQISGETLIHSASARVQFKGVWFRYQHELPFVLKGVNLDIAAGERIGIVGRTGSGKSSMIQALFHLYDISEGEISIDGRSVKNSDLELYRRSLSFISQESILFKGTLQENLDINCTMPKNLLITALERVGLPEFASENGLAMAIEEKGRNLSLGEKQLICMARCLLQDAPVVIMDEATSSVDPQSEEILVRATDEFFSNRTQIIIAHRLSTLKKCHRIVWLDQGEIKMIGAPENVLPAFESQSLGQA